MRAGDTIESRLSRLAGAESPAGGAEFVGLVRRRGRRRALVRGAGLAAAVLLTGGAWWAARESPRAAPAPVPMAQVDTAPGASLAVLRRVDPDGIDLDARIAAPGRARAVRWPVEQLTSDLAGG